ncbi:MAG TPA: dihydrolipoamide acetyltransferase family protein [Rudaea sp.]|jgi:pyruvate dehydrogenase E2 component (dihydrolipoamide acetyltransferase)|uniref:dihydrolipoamide acetyltransferase family protein n=1 Tax=Rudaea sp. TaxID=2136325 RepID=UPI002F94D6A9
MSESSPPETRTFRLPDLGEGLPDATIVEWLVKPGDAVKLDAPLVSMETAKAIVEVPSPYSGKLLKVYGANGDVIATGAALADFEIDASAPQRAESEETGHHAAAPAPASVRSEADKPDAGTVVGTMQTSDRLVSEAAIAVGGVKAVPAVRALAKKLNVDLSRIIPSRADGVVSAQDVKDAAAAGTAKRGASAPTREEAAPAQATARAGSAEPSRRGSDARPASPPSAVMASPAPSATRPHATTAEGSEYGEPAQLKGVRRNMARVMADAHAKVVLTTIFDDADIQAWRPGNDISVRLLRAIVAACKAVPALNAWFDGEQLTRTLHSHVDIGIAVDTADGLFVPALRNADVLDAKHLRTALDDLLKSVRDRSIPPQELAGYTISLSNFGVFAGRYATPIVVPPCVAIVAAGKLSHDVVAVMGGIETHRVMPISLSFDHRAVTGGEAARFLQALLGDLALAN